MCMIYRELIYKTFLLIQIDFLKNRSLFLFQTLSPIFLLKRFILYIIEEIFSERWTSVFLLYLTYTWTLEKPSQRSYTVELDSSRCNLLRLFSNVNVWLYKWFSCSFMTDEFASKNTYNSWSLLISKYSRALNIYTCFILERVYSLSCNLYHWFVLFKLYWLVAG